jgi:hypothetical protein
MHNLLVFNQLFLYMGEKQKKIRLGQHCRPNLLKIISTVKKEVGGDEGANFVRRPARPRRARERSVTP